MKSFYTKLRQEEGYGGIVEALVGSVITFIAMSATALAINGSLQTTLSAQNYSKAASYIQEVFSVAKNTEYNKLGINLESEQSGNIVDIQAKDIQGCNPYLTTFEAEYHNEKSGSQLPYCQIKSPTSENGGGISFNVETHITNVGLTEINNDFRNQFGFNGSSVYAKRVTVIVSWWEGDRDVNKLPILKSAESEILITPSLGFCPPSVTGVTAGCNN